MVFRDVTEIDADSVPNGGITAHAVDEDIVDGEISGGRRVFFLPAGEASFGGRFVWGLGNGE